MRWQFWYWVILHHTYPPFPFLTCVKRRYQYCIKHSINKAILLTTVARLACIFVLWEFFQFSEYWLISAAGSHVVFFCDICFVDDSADVLVIVFKLLFVHYLWHFLQFWLVYMNISFQCLWHGQASERHPICKKTGAWLTDGWTDRIPIPNRASALLWWRAKWVI